MMEEILTIIKATLVNVSTFTHLQKRIRLLAKNAYDSNIDKGNLYTQAYTSTSNAVINLLICCALIMKFISNN